MSNSNFDTFELVYQGLKDPSPESERKVKSILIGDLELSIPDVQRVLSTTPSVVISSSTKAPLVKAMKALKAVGAYASVDKVGGDNEEDSDLASEEDGSLVEDSDGFSFELDLSELDQASKPQRATKVWELNLDEESAQLESVDLGVDLNINKISSDVVSSSDPFEDSSISESQRVSEGIVSDPPDDELSLNPVTSSEVGDEAEESDSEQDDELVLETKEVNESLSLDEELTLSVSDESEPLSALNSSEVNEVEDSTYEGEEPSISDSDESLEFSLSTEEESFEKDSQLSSNSGEEEELDLALDSTESESSELEALELSLEGEKEVLESTREDSLSSLEDEVQSDSGLNLESELQEGSLSLESEEEEELELPNYEPFAPSDDVKEELVGESGLDDEPELNLTSSSDLGEQELSSSIDLELKGKGELEEDLIEESQEVSKAQEKIDEETSFVKEDTHIEDEIGIDEIEEDSTVEESVIELSTESDDSINLIETEADEPISDLETSSLPNSSKSKTKKKTETKRSGSFIKEYGLPLFFVSVLFIGANYLIFSKLIPNQGNQSTLTTRVDDELMSKIVIVSKPEGTATPLPKFLPIDEVVTRSVVPTLEHPQFSLRAKCDFSTVGILSCTLNGAGKESPKLTKRQIALKEKRVPWVRRFESDELIFVERTADGVRVAEGAVRLFIEYGGESHRLVGTADLLVEGGRRSSKIDEKGSDSKSVQAIESKNELVEEQSLFGSDEKKEARLIIDVVSNSDPISKAGLEVDLSSEKIEDLSLSLHADLAIE